MAEEHVEQRKWPGLWLKILAFVVIGLLMWAVWQFFKEGTKTARDGTPDTTVAVPAVIVDVPAQVSDFASFIRDNPAQEAMTLEHDYTSDGIRRLANALAAIVDQHDITDPDIKDKLDLLREHADRLQKDHHSTQHADTVRDAFILATGLIASIERQIEPDMKDGVSEVRRAAEAIDPDKLVLDQKAEVETFFKETSRLLNEMAHQKS